MSVRSSGMRVLSLDCIFRMKFPIGFTYRNLHAFARFPCDSTVLVLFLELLADCGWKFEVVVIVVDTVYHTHNKLYTVCT